MEQRSQTQPEDGTYPVFVEHGCHGKETERRGKGTRRGIGIHDGKGSACNRKSEAASCKQYCSPGAAAVGKHACSQLPGAQKEEKYRGQVADQQQHRQSAPVKQGG